MVLPLNVSFGVWAFLPLGWLFMLSIILLEAITISKMLGLRLNAGLRIALVSNIVSGIVGIVISLMLNGGWWLVVWFPWVSSHEVKTDNPQDLVFLAIYYICAFVLTLLLEYATNYTQLLRHHTPRKIAMVTLVTNAISYSAGTLVLYGYSFG